MKVALFAYAEMGATALEVLLERGFEVPLLVTHRDDPGERGTGAGDTVAGT